MPFEGRPLQPKRSNCNLAAEDQDEYEGCAKRARMQAGPPRAREPVRAMTSWVPVADHLGALTMRRCIADFGQGFLALESGQLVQIAAEGTYYLLTQTCIDEIS